MIAVLVTIVAALLGGAPFVGALGAVTLVQWVILAGELAVSTPQAQADFAKLHPLLAELVKNLGNGMHPIHAAGQVHRAFAAISEEEARVEQGLGHG